MVKKTDIALLLGLGVVGFILISQLKNIQFPSFEFPKLPSIIQTSTSDTPTLEIQPIQQQPERFSVFDSIRQAVEKIVTPSAFDIRAAAVSPVTQSGEFVQQVDAFGRPIRSIF